MSNDPAIFVGVVVAAFVAGWLLAKIAAAAGGRGASGEQPDEHHRIRSLEASLRVAQRKAEEMTDQFEATSVDFNALKQSHEELGTVIAEREAEVLDARQATREEAAKVRRLRRELTARSEAKIRAEAHAKDVETELSVMHAGSTAMKDEVDRLAAEREDLTNRLHAATGTFPNPMDEPADDDRERSSEEFMPDC
ncbi:MAG: hypothetical protein ACE5G3_05170 [Gammaproteobacteria bacterium]